MEDRPGTPSPPPRPRWVNILLIIVGVVVAIAIVMAFTGEHGPARHLSQGRLEIVQAG